MKHSMKLKCFYSLLSRVMILQFSSDDDDDDNDSSGKYLTQAL